MAFDYDETNPTNTSFIADFPQNERDQRLAVLSSTNVDHDAEGLGEHKKVTLQRQGVDPTLSGTAGFIYTKLVGAITELFFKDDTAQVVQLTDAGSASPDKVSVTGDEMTGDLQMTNADVLLEGTSLVKLQNLLALQGRDFADANWRDIALIDASDVVNIGDVLLAGGMRLNGFGINDLVAEYGAGDKAIWHAGHFPNAPNFTTQFESTGNAFTWTGSGSRTTVPHTIGAVPKLWFVVLECTVPQDSYLVGDEIPIMTSWFGGTPAGIGVSVDTSNFYYWVSDTQGNIMKANGNSESIVDTSWTITFRGWF